MKKFTIIKIIFLLILLPIILFSFYKINKENYIVIEKFKLNNVNHPENLPTNEIAKLTSFGFKNFRADIYWLEAIQYIGSNAVQADYKKYLYKITDLITDLNPYFDHPYVLAEILLPETNAKYEDFEKNELEDFKDQAIAIGLKGIGNFCDEEKLQKVLNEYDIEKIQFDEDLKNACKNYKIPFYLAYNYYMHKNDAEKSSYYYKVAATNEDVVEGAKTLAILMLSKGGNREKSISMFIAMAESEAGDDEVCMYFVTNYLKPIYNYETYRNPDTLKQLEDLSLEIFGKYSDNENILTNGCQSYSLKTIREFNLAYLDEANSKYYTDNGSYAQTPEELLENGYIDFIPNDYQQYDTYGIKYYFSEERQCFDYKMANN